MARSSSKVDNVDKIKSVTFIGFKLKVVLVPLSRTNVYGVPKFRVHTTPILLLELKGGVRFRSRFRIPNLAKRVVHIFKRNRPKESFILLLEIVQ
jgi:hypothetical protein